MNWCFRVFNLLSTGKSELVWRFNLENLVFLRHGYICFITGVSNQATIRLNKCLKKVKKLFTVNFFLSIMALHLYCKGWQRVLLQLSRSLGVFITLLLFSSVRLHSMFRWTVGCQCPGSGYCVWAHYGCLMSWSTQCCPATAVPDRISWTQKYPALSALPWLTALSSRRPPWKLSLDVQTFLVTSAVVLNIICKINLEFH